MYVLINNKYEVQITLNFIFIEEENISRIASCYLLLMHVRKMSNTKSYKYFVHVK